MQLELKKLEGGPFGLFDKFLDLRLNDYEKSGIFSPRIVISQKAHV